MKWFAQLDLHRADSLVKDEANSNYKRKEKQTPTAAKTNLKEPAFDKHHKVVYNAHTNRFKDIHPTANPQNRVQRAIQSKEPRTTT